MEMAKSEVVRFADCKWGREGEGARSRVIGHSQAATPPNSSFTTSQCRTGNVS